MKMKLFKLFTLALVGTVGTGCSLFGIRSGEQPNYDVLLKQDRYEIRKYNSHIIAKTTVSGSFEEAQSRGFKILAGYIFGKNKAQEKIAMTSPVLQKPEESSEKIAMTAPVIMAPETKGKGANVQSWTMTFSMPSKYSLETLPVPDDDRIVIETVAPRFVAVNVFSGFWSESKNQSKGNELLEWLSKENQYNPISKPMFAGYNPPWTIPFFRRNEMLIEIKPIN